MTRNRVRYGGLTAEKCGVALMPPAEARAAVVVLLPLAYTWEVGGAECLTRREAAGALVAYCLVRKVSPKQVHKNGKLLADFQNMLRADGVELEWPRLTPR